MARASPLPLPIAALLRQARRTTDATRRHLFAYFAWEASVRLAVAAAPPSDPRPLELPSTGTFVAAMPRGGRPVSAPELLEVARLFAEETESPKPGGRSLPAERLLALLPAYRNRVVGHGAPRPDAWCQRAADVLLAGLPLAWEAEIFWPRGASLVYLDRIELDERGQRRARVFRLDGDVPEVEALADLREDALPRRLYLAAATGLVSLHPWVLFEELAAGERVLFFNGRKRAKAEYLDYLTGEAVLSKALAARYPGLDEDLSALFGAQGPPSAEPSAKGYVQPESRAARLASGRARRWPWIALGLGLAGAAAVGGARMVRGPGAPASASASASASVPSPAAAGTAPVVSVDPEVQEQFLRALDALLDADVEAAERGLRDVQAREPKAAWATAALGLAEGALDRYEEHWRLLEKARELAGEAQGWDAELLRLLPRGLETGDKLVGDWARLEARAPGVALIPILAALTLSRRGSQEEQEQRFRRALDQTPKRARVSLLYSEWLQRHERLDDALKAVSDGLARRPRSPWLLLQRGTVHLAKGDQAAARVDVEAALALGAPFRAQIAYALLLLVSGAPEDEARRKNELERLLSSPATSDDDRLSLLCVQALGLERAGRVQEGEALLARLGDLAEQKRKPSTLLRCALFATHVDVGLERWAEGERHLDLAKRALTGVFGMTAAERDAAAALVEEMSGVLAVGAGRVDDGKKIFARLEDATKLGMTQRANGLRIALALAGAGDLPAPPRSGASVAVRARYLAASARIAEARKDLEAARKTLRGALPLVTPCLGSTQYLEFPCGPEIVAALARLAELHLEAKDEAAAKEAVTAARRLWPKPDEALALAKRLAKLERRLR